MEYSFLKYKFFAHKKNHCLQPQKRSKKKIKKITKLLPKKKEKRKMEIMK
jgi:hypothetical protein